jgi:hypothetical protein
VDCDTEINLRIGFPENVRNYSLHYCYKTPFKQSCDKNRNELRDDRGTALWEMSTKNHIVAAHFSIAFCIVIVLLMPTTTMVYGEKSSSQSGSGASTPSDGLSSEFSGTGSGTANSTGSTGSGGSSNTFGGNQDNQDNKVPSSLEHGETTHCDQPQWPSCYSLGFQDGKNHAGSICPPGHSANFCSGWNVGAKVGTNEASSYMSSSSCPISPIKGHCPPTEITSATGLGTIREIAPGAPAGSHTLEYIQAFNTASANPYKPGTEHYQNYQEGLDDAKKAGRDCDKMDTCGGPDLLGNYINGILHLNDQQYCGNGFGVYSSKLCKFREGCTVDSLGTVTCPPPKPPLPRNCHSILGKLICRRPPSI